MRCLTSGACAVLSGALWLGSALAADAAEDLPQYTVPRAEAAKAASAVDAEGLELDLVFPLSQLPQLRGTTGEVEIDLRPSNRRPEALRRLFSQAQAEPELFSPDAQRPPKPLTGEWSEKAIWQSDYVDTWGTHPATPVPSRTPRYGLRLSDIQVVPVAGEESVEATKCTAGEKCSKCEACKCAGCPGKQCQGAETQPEHGETAKVILELMETLGRSVLDGTVFQKPGQVDQEWLKELSADGQVSPREALIQYIRHLEAQEEQARTRQAVEEEEVEFEFVSHPLLIGRSPCSCPLNDCECAATCRACPAASTCRECPSACRAGSTACRDCPAECAECRDCPADGCAHLAVHAPRLGDDSESEVEVLREMSSHLEMAAQEMERREIYHRADQLREVAGHLRQDARRSSFARAARKTHGTYAPQPPQRDMQAQLNELREELHRTRTELEQARGKRPPSR